MTMDVTGAFLYGNIRRNVYIELPSEERGSRNVVGRLNKALYGLRDAPLIWAEEVQSTLKEVGLQNCVTNPCVFFDTNRDVQVVVHVDDLMMVGPRAELERIRAHLAERYEIKHKTLGPDYGEEGCVEYLGRQVWWTAKGIEVEADMKHVQALLNL